MRMCPNNNGFNNFFKGFWSFIWFLILCTLIFYQLIITFFFPLRWNICILLIEIFLLFFILYHNDFGKYNYSNFLTKYLKSFELLEEEKHLLFLMLSFPIELKTGQNHCDRDLLNQVWVYQPCNGPNL